MTLKYIYSTDDVVWVRQMPTWKCTGTEVPAEKAQESLDKTMSACFGCQIHSNDYPIAHAAQEIACMIEE